MNARQRRLQRREWDRRFAERAPMPQDMIHVSIGYRIGKPDKNERCLYCGTKAKRFAYTYFGAPVCEQDWDTRWRLSEDGEADPPFAEITNTSSGYWIGTQESGK